MKKAISILLLIFSSSAVYSVVPLDTNWRNVFQWYIQPPPLCAAVDSSGLVIGGAMYYGTIKPIPGYKFDTLNWIAKWNGEDWVPFIDSLGSNGVKSQYDIIFPFTIPVQTLLFADNKLFVGGFFDSAGNRPCRSIAFWDGKNWNCLGTGIKGFVHDLAYHNGNLYVVGSFDSAGNVPANNIARWNGNNWYSLGAGIYKHYLSPVSGEGRSVVVDKNGIVYVGGFFDSAGSVAAKNLAFWDGQSWNAFSPQLFDSVSDEESIIYSMAIFKDSLLFVGGSFGVEKDGKTFNNVAYWDGANWKTVGSKGLSNWCNKIVTDEDFVYFAGAFTQADNIEVNHIAKYRNGVWHTFGSGVDNEVFDIVVYEKESNKIVFVTGKFHNVGDTTQSPRIAIWSEQPIQLPIFSSTKTSNEPQLQNFDFTIYPNPTSEPHVKIALSNSIFPSFNVILSDILGNKVIKLTLSNKDTQFSLELDTLPKGLYFITVTNGFKGITKKLIKI